MAVELVVFDLAGTTVYDDNAGCGGVIGVLSGAMTAEVLGRHQHTHLIPSVADLPDLLVEEFGVRRSPVSAEAGSPESSQG